MQARHKFGAVTMGLHWLMAILVLVAFATGLEGHDEVLMYGVQGLFARQLHETLGLAVFALLFARIVGRLLSRTPEPEPMPRWMHIASKALQGFLYLLMIAVPVTAMLGTGGEGHTIALLNGTEITPPIQVGEAWGERLIGLHHLLANVILWLAGLHAAAALFHHLILRDGVLVSMLPQALTDKLPGTTAIR